MLCVLFTALGISGFTESTDTVAFESVLDLLEIPVTYGKLARNLWFCLFVYLLGCLFVCLFVCLFLTCSISSVSVSVSVFYCSTITNFALSTCTFNNNRIGLC